MIDPKLLGDLAKDHAQNRLSREEAKAFLGALAALCDKHKVFLRSTDQILQFSKVFADSPVRTRFKAMVDKHGNCPAARIEMR